MSRYRQDSAIVSRRIGEETVLVPVRQNVGDLESIFTLNPVGTLVWGRLSGGATVEDLAGAVAGEFDVTAARAASDIRAFLQEMARLGLVEERPDAA